MFFFTCCCSGITIELQSGAITALFLRLHTPHAPLPPILISPPPRLVKGQSNDDSDDKDCDHGNYHDRDADDGNGNLIT